MRTILGTLLLPAALLIAVGPASAGGLGRVGTAGAQELRIPVGAAAIALGGSGVAVGNGLANVYWNPAALAGMDQSEAMVSYSTWLDDATVNYVAASTRLGTQGNVAVSLKILNVGDITVTTEDAPEGTGDILTPHFAVLGLTYARRMTDRVLIGGTGHYVSEKVADASATGFAVDLGVQYDTGWRGLRFGFAMKNVGPNMQYGGPDFERRLTLPGDDPAAQPHVVRLTSASFEIPSYLQMGVAYDFPLAEGRTLALTGAFQGNNFSTDEYRVGAQLDLGSWLALRGGFQGQVPVKESARQDGYLYNLSYGAGFNFKLGDHPVTLDWAGQSVGQFFQDNQQVSLHIAF
jgi:Type IX secretion system protein PorV